MPGMAVPVHLLLVKTIWQSMQMKVTWMQGLCIPLQDGLCNGLEGLGSGVLGLRPSPSPASRRQHRFPSSLAPVKTADSTPQLIGPVETTGHQSPSLSSLTIFGF